MNQCWDMVILDGDVVKIVADDDEQLALLRQLVNDREDEVATFVRTARDAHAADDPVVTLHFDRAVFDEIMRRRKRVHQNLL